jgi:hypothetical protein
MKRLFLIFFAILLFACSSWAAPVASTPAPSTQARTSHRARLLRVKHKHRRKRAHHKRHQAKARHSAT